MGTSKKYIFWVVLALVIIAAAAYYWWSQKPPATDKATKNETKTPTVTQQYEPTNTGGGGCGLTKASWGVHGKTVLKKGSSGCAVSLLQTALNAVFDNKLAVDGKFGTNTEKALEKAFKIGGFLPIAYPGQTTLELLDTFSIGKVYKLFI